MIKQLLGLADPLCQLQRKQHKLLQSAALPAPLLSLLAEALFDSDTLLFQQPILAIDLETTGLDPEQDEILSIGMVTIENEKILLNSAVHYYLGRPEAVKAETAVINHITPEQLKGHAIPSDILTLFLQQAQGKWLLAHGSAIEQTFLAKAFGIKELPLLWLDTMNIEKSLLSHKTRNQNRYSLDHLRQLYGLPDYDAHNALSDAVAAAELFLAQTKVLFPNQPASLQPLYRRSVTAVA